MPYAVGEPSPLIAAVGPLGIAATGATAGLAGGAAAPPLRTSPAGGGVNWQEHSVTVASVIHASGRNRRHGAASCRSPNCEGLL